MVSVNTIVLIGIIIFFLILNLIIILLTVFEARNLSRCANNQSIWCPSVTCNQDGPNEQTTAGQSCFPYAYRYTNDEQTEWICNFPLSGLTPIASTDSDS